MIAATANLKDVPQEKRSHFAPMRPLLPLRGASALLNLLGNVVLALIDNGELPFVFDISLAGTEARTREVRIAPQAVAAQMRGERCKLSWEEFEEALPIDGEMIRVEVVQQFLNCSNVHVLELGRKGLLGVCTKIRPGRAHATKFSSRSFVEFLRNRRIS